MFLFILGYCKSQRSIFQSFTVFNKIGPSHMPSPVIEPGVSQAGCCLEIFPAAFAKYYKFVCN